MAQSISSLGLDSGDNITIFGKNFEVTPAIRDHIMFKISKMEELTPPTTRVHVYLDIQREAHHVEIEYCFSHFKIVVTHGMVLKSATKVDDMYRAIDMAFDKLKGKIRRWKTRIQAHHHKKPFEIEEKSIQVLNKKTQDIDYINDQIEEASTKRFEEEFSLPLIVKHKKRQIPLLTLEEATMRIDLCDDNFLVYRSEEEQKLKVMYVRRDKTLGVLDIE